MDDIYQRFKKDRFAAYNQISIDEIKKGYARSSVKITKHHLNGVDITQGGLIYTLADVAFAAASNSYGPIAVGLTTNISFFNATGENDVLVAIAKVVSKTKKTCSVDVDITCQEKLIAKMTGTAYIKSENV